jgi:hypothetical protein
MTITERLTDMAGKYRVLVEIDNTRAIPLKYNNEVDDSVAFADAKVILNREAEQQKQQDYLNNLMAEEKQLMEELGIWK